MFIGKTAKNYVWNLYGNYKNLFYERKRLTLEKRHDIYILDVTFHEGKRGVFPNKNKCVYPSPQA